MTSPPVPQSHSQEKAQPQPIRLSQLGEGFKDVAQFLEKITTKVDGRVVFRGHANADWALQPSALRSNVYGIRNRYHLNCWKAIAGKFVSANSDLEWLALAQHYGVATPLLDWTTNPLVALFFAAQHARQINGEADGVVYMVDLSSFNQRPDPTFDVFSDWSGVPFYLSEGFHRRAVSQSSVMTLHPPNASSPTVYKSEIVYKLPGWAKFGVQAALKKLGLGAEDLYADINTAASEFSARLRMECGRDFSAHSLIP
ncbi:FRG domain-containing protein [Gluconobacter kondonii NBRC 3266]|nr:FRG domain-containing protein [Gluconobacter kondonii NBRC 3266]